MEKEYGVMPAITEKGDDAKKMGMKIKAEDPKGNYKMDSGAKPGTGCKGNLSATMSFLKGGG